MGNQQLDICQVRLREKHPTIFHIFDEMKVVETFQLINDNDPIQLYYK